MTTASPAIVDTDGSREQVWPLPTDEQSLLDLIHLCFEGYWDDIWFGVLIQGAAVGSRGAQPAQAHFDVRRLRHH